MTPGTASCTKFSYSPKAPHARHNAEHMQRTCKKLLKKRTSKKLARTSKKLARNPKILQRISKKPAKQISKSQTAYYMLRRDSTPTNAELQGPFRNAPWRHFGLSVMNSGRNVVVSQRYFLGCLLYFGSHVSPNSSQANRQKKQKPAETCQQRLRAHRQSNRNTIDNF